MKKLLLFIITTIAFVNIAFADGVTVNINEIPQSFPNDMIPFISADGRTMVPTRFVSERLGASVKWLDGVVEIDSGDGKVIVMKVGEKKWVLKSGGKEEKKEMDTKVVNVNGRVFVPLKFVSESLGAKVSWDEKGKIASIVSDKVKRDTSRLFDKLMGTGEFELVQEDKSLGWAKARPKDLKAKYEIERVQPGLFNGVYVQEADLGIRLTSYDLYTRHKVRDLLKLILPIQGNKAYDYLILTLREEVFELENALSIFPGIDDIYIDNREFKIVKNTNSGASGISIGMDGVKSKKEEFRFKATVGKSLNYDWQYKEYQLDQY